MRFSTQIRKRQGRFTPLMRLVNNKAAARLHVKRLGVPVPYLYCHTEFARFLPIIDGSVIKPVYGEQSIKVYLFRDGRDLFTGLPIDRVQILRELGTPTTPPTGMEFISEELLEDVTGHPIPIDYKFYVFGGHHVPLIAAIKRYNHREYERTYYDGDFNMLNWRVAETHCFTEPALAIEKPACFDLMKQYVLKLARSLGFFVRVDMYATTKGPMFGEFSVVPNGGFGYTRRADLFLTEQWRQHPDRLPARTKSHD